MLAIITGTIRPSQKMKQLVLRDENERFKQYEEGLRFLLESRAFSKVIFCENSGFGAEKLSCLIDMVSGKDMELELLSFQGMLKRHVLMGRATERRNHEVCFFPQQAYFGRAIFRQDNGKA